jgi:hypothetical protein
MICSIFFRLENKRFFDIITFFPVNFDEWNEMIWSIVVKKNIKIWSKDLFHKQKYSFYLFNKKILFIYLTKTGLEEKVEKKNIEKVNVEKIIKKENIEKENAENDNVEI